MVLLKRPLSKVVVLRLINLSWFEVAWGKTIMYHMLPRQYLGFNGKNRIGIDEISFNILIRIKEYKFDCPQRSNEVHFLIFKCQILR